MSIIPSDSHELKHIIDVVEYHCDKRDFVGQMYLRHLLSDVELTTLVLPLHFCSSNLLTQLVMESFSPIDLPFGDF